MIEISQNRKLEIFLWAGAAIVAVPLAFIFEFVRFRRGTFTAGINDEFFVPLLTLLGLTLICVHALRFLRRVVTDKRLGE